MDPASDLARTPPARARRAAAMAAPSGAGRVVASCFFGSGPRRSRLPSTPVTTASPLVSARASWTPQASEFVCTSADRQTSCAPCCRVMDVKPRLDSHGCPFRPVTRPRARGRRSRRRFARCRPCHTDGRGRRRLSVYVASRRFGDAPRSREQQEWRSEPVLRRRARRARDS